MIELIEDLKAVVRADVIPFFQKWVRADTIDKVLHECAIDDVVFDLVCVKDAAVDAVLRRTALRECLQATRAELLRIMDTADKATRRMNAALADASVVRAEVAELKQALSQSDAEVVNLRSSVDTLTHALKESNKQRMRLEIRLNAMGANPEED